MNINFWNVSEYPSLYKARGKSLLEITYIFLEIKRNHEKSREIIEITEIKEIKKKSKKLKKSRRNQRNQEEIREIKEINRNPIEIIRNQKNQREINYDIFTEKRKRNAKMFCLSSLSIKFPPL